MSLYFWVYCLKILDNINSYWVFNDILGMFLRVLYELIGFIF